MVAAVSVEFCLVFWAADAFDEWHDAGDAAAPALAATFLVGMAASRLFAARLTGGHHPSRVVLLACGVAAGRFRSASGRRRSRGRPRSGCSSPAQGSHFSIP